MAIKPIDITPESYSRQYHATVCSEVKQLASVLKCYGISHFSHTRNYGKNIGTLLTTDPEFSDLFVRENFHKDIFCAEPHQYKKSVVLDSELGNLKIRKALSSHQIANVITFIQPAINYTDFWYFGTKPGNDTIIEFYYSNINLLSDFITYFKQRGHKILKQSFRNRMRYPGQMGDNSILISDEIMQVNLLCQNDIINHAQFDTSLFDLALKKQFTLEETCCAALLMKGYCPKEIAKIRNKSVRTVEKHIINLRNKMGSRSSIHLVAQLYCKNISKALI